LENFCGIFVFSRTMKKPEVSFVRIMTSEDSEYKITFLKPVKSKR
jgi:hypothetical protein